MYKRQGNSSSEDFLSLSEWLNADEKNKKEFRLLKSYWDAEVSFSHSLMPNAVSYTHLFTAIMEPYALKEQLEKVLISNQKLSPEVLRKVKELNNRITDDDNCIVFIGKLKTK